MSRTTIVAVFANDSSLLHHTQLNLPSALPLYPIQEEDESAVTLFTNLAATVNEGDAKQITASVAVIDPAMVDLVKLCTCGAGLVQDQHFTPQMRILFRW